MSEMSFLSGGNSVLLETQNLKNSYSLQNGSGDVKKNDTTQELSEEEKREVESLKRKDKEVKQRERSKALAAGKLISSSLKFKFKIGPDGKKYAVSGSLKMDTNEVLNDPEGTIKKAKDIRKAALTSPPSQEDKKIAAEAARMEQRAKIELSKNKRSEQQAEELQKAEERKNEKEENEVGPNYTADGLAEQGDDHSLLDVKVK